MKYLILFLLLFTTSPVEAFTWNDLVRWADTPPTRRGPYIRNRKERCWKRITWEEYTPGVPGSGREAGRVKHHNHLEEIHC